MKITPKIELLMQSEHIGVVNDMLDAGKSPYSVQKYLTAQGCSISVPIVYKYQAMRREGLLQDVAVSEAADVEVSDGSSMRRRLLMEIEALDALIEKGYAAIRDLDPAEVTPRLMMDAIRLKYELTGGSHAFLTEYGYSSLKKLNDKKWQRVIEYLLSFVSEDRQEEVQRGVAEIEESIYAGTPWQDEYRKAKERSGS